MKDRKAFAESALGEPFDSMDDVHRRVARHVADHRHISRDVEAEMSEQATFGQRAADAVANFGGSWTFIGMFAATLIVWVAFNSWVLALSLVEANGFDIDARGVGHGPDRNVV